MKTAIRSAAIFVSLLVLPSAHAQKNTTIKDKEIIVVVHEDLAYPPLARMARIQGVVVGPDIVDHY
jgi:hypothetical protein